MRKFYITLVILSNLLVINGFSQSVMDPNDAVVTYNGTAPAQPAYGQIGKWIRTKRLSWNTDAYKCYIYKGSAFRLLFPKSYVPGVSDGKKYPMVVMFHGLGEKGPITDNEYQLYHSGDVQLAAENNGTYDGYALYMQSTGFFSTGQEGLITEIINYMVTNNKLDPFRVSVHGLSAGGQAAWEMVMNFPTYVAADIPMSAASLTYATPANTNLLKFTPMWNFQGGQDGAPAPGTAQRVRDSMVAHGANYKYTEYADLGHGVWDRAYTEPDFWPFILRAYKSNPWPLFGRTEFCPGDPINVVLGVTAGFTAYQWRKDGVVISGATSNILTVTQLGTYDCRVQKGTLWSDWSPIPVVIKTKAATVPPPITISGLMSNVIPSLDGNNGVTLKVPSGYATYLWQKVGNNTVLSTDSTYYATNAGDYTVKVTEQYGCSSNFSNPFTVINANGINKPDPAVNLLVTPISKTALRLDWSDNPSAAYNETNFEVYQANQAGGPYTLIGIVGQNVVTYTSSGLNANTKYFYKIRAVNNTAASAASNEANGITIADNQPPTAPANLLITSKTRTSVSLSWTASTDDVGVSKYEVYVNGAKTYVTSQTQFIVTNLETGKSYNFAVKARDLANNLSPFSNQVTGQPYLAGLNYKYFTFTGSWSKLKDLTALVPNATGTMPNVAITPRSQEDNFSFLWEGYIIIPQSGTYYFRTNSDDGSKLYLGTLNDIGSPYPNSNYVVVDNDGAHGAQDRTSSALSLSAGTYPFAVAYYENTGGQSITVSWRTPQTGFSFVTIPNAAFADNVVSNGNAPADPSNLKASAVSYNRIDLTWNDNSNNESGFEIWRSSVAASGFAVVGNAAANATSFVDTNSLAANTTYYYQIRAIGQFGESNLVSNIYQNIEDAKWQFNNSYADSSGNSRSLTSSGSPTFDAANKKEGTHSILLNGTSQYVTPTSSTFLQTSYSQKTVAFWMQSNNNTGSRVIVDIGGGDNGLSLLLNSNTLYAGVASGNNRINISTSYSSTGWNHIALVYSGSTLKLYVNGVLASSNTALGFSSIGTSGSLSRIGTVNGSNAFNTGSGFFAGRIDNFIIYNKALTQADITNIMNGSPISLSFATTSALPSVPNTPTTLIASAASKSAINITWNDNSNDETKFELYRSANNNGNYLLYATLPTNSTSFVDTGLFANAIYYYKVRAINAGGFSAYATEDSSKTLNNLPVISKLNDRSARFNATTTIALSAFDNDGDPLSFASNNLPSFAILTDNGDKTATLSLNPTEADQAVYNTIQVIANDTHGGSDTTSFNLTVNNNYDPQLSDISNYIINENDTLSIPLNALDDNSSDILSFSVTNIPDAFAIIPISNGVANLFVRPNYAASGTYNIQVNVTDGNGGTATKNFNLTVNDKDPNSIVYLRFKDLATAPSPWNNITGISTSNLLDATGANSGMNFELQTPAFNVYHNGPQTGNNSGVYPDAVLEDYYYFGIYGAPETVSAKLTNLDTTRVYNLTFYAGSIFGNVADNGTTTYSVGSKTVSLYVQNNTQNTVSINDLKPESDGTITINMAKAADGTPVGYLNAMVITSSYNDGTAPVTPKNFIVQNASRGVQLLWQDVAYNEKGYEVYRSLDPLNGFALVGNATNPNVTSFIDSTISGNVHYYYKVRGINDYGQSPFTDVKDIVTLDRIPKVNAIANVVLKNNQQTTVNVTAVDDATDHIRLSASGLPSFATFVDNGNGTGTITIQPSAGITGTYQGATITAKDDSDSTGSASFDISIVDVNVAAVYVNFSDASTAGKPWNNMAGYPIVGATLNNLLDDSNNPTGMSVTLVNGFQGSIATGMQPGNGQTVYPETVVRTSIYEGSTNTRTIRFSGLSNTKKYNFVFFGSHDFNLNGTTNFTINGQTVTLNATYNLNKTVQINGVSPDVNGQVNISVAKATGADYAYVSAIVVQVYNNDATLLLSPTDLRVIQTKRTAVTLQWQDRSANETGFEIWRANDSTGAQYVKIATVAANTTSYTNTSLTTNKTYYYTVRSINATKNSAYSNVATGITLASSIYLNCTAIDLASAPWNNTAAAPVLGYTWSNFYDDAGYNSSTGMAITSAFSEVQPLGMSTGNNSGGQPDAVLASCYFVFPGVTGQIKITGLNLGMHYNFTFSGSTLVNDNAVSAYIINGKTYKLNAQLNIGFGTVTAYDLVPDANGEITVTIMRASNVSLGGYLGSLIIQGANPPKASSIPQPPGSGLLGITMKQNDKKDAQVVKNSNGDDDITIKAYPNPFTKYFNLVVPAKYNEKVTVAVYDLNGKVVYLNQFGGLNSGNNTLHIEENKAMANTGVYIVKVMYNDRKIDRTIKIIKE